MEIFNMVPDKLPQNDFFGFAVLVTFYNNIVETKKISSLTA